jgi:hypothetical protein
LEHLVLECGLGEMPVAGGQRPGQRQGLRLARCGSTPDIRSTVDGLERSGLCQPGQCPTARLPRATSIGR